MAPAAPGSAEGQEVTTSPSPATPRDNSPDRTRSQALQFGAQSFPRDGDVQELWSSAGGVPKRRAVVPPSSPSSTTQSPLRGSSVLPSSSLNPGSGAAALPRALLPWQPLRALDFWPSRPFVLFKASLLESAWLLPASGSQHFPTVPRTASPANRK